MRQLVHGRQVEWFNRAGHQVQPGNLADILLAIWCIYSIGLIKGQAEAVMQQKRLDPNIPKPGTTISWYQMRNTQTDDMSAFMGKWQQTLAKVLPCPTEEGLIWEFRTTFARDLPEYQVTNISLHVHICDGKHSTMHGNKANTPS
eukprot:364556-Chlamydomonas_euryale.AAC.26